MLGFRKIFVGNVTSMRITLIAFVTILAAGPAAAQKLILDRTSAAKAAAQTAPRSARAAIEAHGQRAEVPGLVLAASRQAADPANQPARRDRV